MNDEIVKINEKFKKLDNSVSKMDENLRKFIESEQSIDSTRNVDTSSPEVKITIRNRIIKLVQKIENLDFQNFESKSILSIFQKYFKNPVSNSPDKPAQKMSTRSRHQDRPSPSAPTTPVGRKIQQKDIPIILNELSEKVDTLQKLSKGQTSIMTKTMQSGKPKTLYILVYTGIY